jgi:Tol biopolymer transport system component
MSRVKDLPHRNPVPGRSLAVSILAMALATTACGGSAASLATAHPSASPAAAAAPSSIPSAAPLPGGRLAYGRFSPDGTHAFTSNTDGTDEKTLVSSIAEGPRWSPDGRHLSVVVQSPQGLLFVGLVKSDGSDYVRFDSPDPTLNLGCFAWSPDASRLACEGWDDTNSARNGIYTVRASDGGDLTRVTTSPTDAHDIPGDYSPDGRQIVFGREGQKGTMFVNVDGTDERALTNQEGGGGSWSPDGKTILTDAQGGTTLLLVPVDGSQPSPIGIGAALAAASRGAWSPDGQWIVFSGIATNSPGEDIYIMRADGTDLHQVTNTPGVDEEFGDWGVAIP